MKAKFFYSAALVAFAIFLGGNCLGQQPAFPGAEGAGMYTSGGRGTLASPTTVFEVTNLTDVNSPGSLRYALSQSTSTVPSRTIVFRVSGTIHLNSKLNIPRNTTIAGQTAPGDGICIADYPVVISGDNVIVRYLRIRMGDKNQLITSPAGCGVPVAPFTPACTPVDGSGGDDALGNLGGKNIIIDHCSISWSNDEALTVYRGDSVTMQWNFIEEPLNYSYHFETGDTDFEQHGYGGIWGSMHGSFHHNLIAHCRNRTPRFAGNSTYGGEIEQADFRNNVLYNWGINNIYGGDGGNYNLVNNYYKYGPNTSSGVRYRIVGVDSTATYGWAKYYLSGNFVDGSATNTNNNWTGAYMLGGNANDSVKSKTLTPFLSTYPQITTESALSAYESVLAGAGATLPKRDTMDKRIVNDVRNRTGRIIDVQGGFPHGTPYANTVNAWPTLATTTAPADTDHDGMPDFWETANGLNINDAADRQVVAANGYTNLENYLNSISTTSPVIDYSGSLSTFDQPDAAPSAVQNVTITGSNLTGAAVIVPPAGFEISVDGGATWVNNSSSITLVPTAGTITATTLSIRLNTITPGIYNQPISITTPDAPVFYISVVGNKGNVPLGTFASATWPLLTNADPTLNGDITATSQTLGSAFAGVSYGSTFGTVAGWQRVATTSYLPVGYSANAYVEYTITPTAGKSFVDTAITLSALGGGTGTARMAIYYSKDGFATAQSVGAITYNSTSYSNLTDNTNSVSLLNTSTATLTGQQVAKANPNITVASGETLSIRVYAWITGTGNRYFPSQNVTVSGYTTDASLPLKLVSFTAALENRQVKLLWQTTNEVNTSKFLIERSFNGVQFSAVGEVKALNNSGNNHYSFADAALLEGLAYYRLKMIDVDGKYKYSSIAIINRNKEGKVSLFPNPAQSTITLTYTKANQSRNAFVFNSRGQQVKSIAIAAGSTQCSVSVSGLAAGNYFLRVEGLAQVLPFLKQ